MRNLSELGRRVAVAMTTHAFTGRAPERILGRVRRELLREGERRSDVESAVDRLGHLVGLAIRGIVEELEDDALLVELVLRGAEPEVAFAIIEGIDEAVDAHERASGRLSRPGPRRRAYASSVATRSRTG